MKKCFSIFLVVSFLFSFVVEAKKLVKPSELAVYHNNLGIRYLDQGNLQLAEDELKTAVELSPDYIEAYNNLGIVAKKRGDLRSSEAFFKKAIALDPKYGVAYSHLATVYLDEGNLTKALQYAKAAREKAPTAPITHYNLALVYMQKTKENPKKDYSEYAEKELKIATELNTQMFEAHRTLARLYRNQGKYDLAIIRYRLAIESHPADSGMWSELGETLLSKGDSAKAENAFRKALSLTGTQNSESSNPHMDLGLKYMTQRDYSQAIEEFKLAIQSDPKNEIAHYRLGTAYLNMGDSLVAKNRGEEAGTYYKSAIEPLHMALSLNPQMVDASYNLGLVYFRLSDYPLAETTWQSTLSIFADHPRTLFNLGMLYGKQNLKEKSNEYFCRFNNVAGSEFTSQKKTAIEIIKASGGKCRN